MLSTRAWVAVVFGLFLVAGASAMALMLRLFIAGQRKIGNDAHPLVRFLSEHETGAVVAFLAMCVVAVVIALPVMIEDGFFGPAAPPETAARPPEPAAGVLVANVGMTLDEVRQRSTVSVPESSATELTGSRTVTAHVVFDFEIADMGMRFPGCRHFYLVTRSRDDPRLEWLNVGVSPDALPRPAFDEFLRRTRERFVATGWARGRRLSPPAGEGLYWLKGNTVVRLDPRRLDPEQPGEDSHAAGQWMLTLSIWDRTTRPSEHFEVIRP